MNKENLIKFIKKYNLGGMVESVLYTIKDNKLSTEFMLQDNTLKGIVTLNPFNYIDDIEFGIYNTEKFLRMLTVLDDNINIDFSKINDKIVYIKVSDSKIDLNFMLAETSVIPSIKSLSNIPKFELDIKLNDYLIDKYIKATSALPDAKTFYIEHDALEETTNLIVNDDNNKIIISVETNNVDEISKPKFDNNKFKEILINNKDSKHRKLLISSKGLLNVSFTDERELFNSEYFMVASAL